MLSERVFSTFQTSAQGLAVQREKIAVASRNIANANTTAPANSDQGYRTQRVVTSVINQESFGKILLESVAALRDGSASPRPSGAQGVHSNIPRGLGPQAQVVSMDQSRYEFDPYHPDADESGMVRYADIDLVREMTEIVSANRLYEANLSAIEAEKNILRRSFEI
jgi:flagellar basal-body rod protein FlgC